MILFGSHYMTEDDYLKTFIRSTFRTVRACIIIYATVRRRALTVRTGKVILGMIGEDFINFL